MGQISSPTSFYGFFPFFNPFQGRGLIVILSSGILSLVNFFNNIRGAKNSGSRDRTSLIPREVVQISRQPLRFTIPCPPDSEGWGKDYQIRASELWQKALDQVKDKSVKPYHLNYPIIEFSVVKHMDEFALHLNDCIDHITIGLHGVIEEQDKYIDRLQKVGDSLDGVYKTRFFQTLQKAIVEYSKAKEEGREYIRNNEPKVILEEELAHQEGLTKNLIGMLEAGLKDLV